MPSEKTRIERLRISGFKSIRDADLTLGSLNVVIGANGSGKSNLVSYFSLLRASLNGRLEEHIGPQGGPNAFLYLGPRTTKEINSVLTFTTEAGRATFSQRLEFQAPDSLVYRHNRRVAPLGVYRTSEVEINYIIDHNIVGSIFSESGYPIVEIITNSLSYNYINIYHFNDTTITAQIRLAGNTEDNRLLHADGANLAAVLFRLKQTQRTAYQRIVGTIRLIAPFLMISALLLGHSIRRESC